MLQPADSICANAEMTLAPLQIRRAGSMPTPVRLTPTRVIALQLDYEQRSAPAQPRTERVSNPSFGWRVRWSATDQKVSRETAEVTFTFTL